MVLVLLTVFLLNTEHNGVNPTNQSSDSSAGKGSRQVKGGFLILKQFHALLVKRFHHATRSQKDFLAQVQDLINMGMMWWVKWLFWLHCVEHINWIDWCEFLERPIWMNLMVLTDTMCLLRTFFEPNLFGIICKSVRLFCTTFSKLSLLCLWLSDSRSSFLPVLSW